MFPEDKTTYWGKTRQRFLARFKSAFPDEYEQHWYRGISEEELIQALHTNEESAFDKVMEWMSSEMGEAIRPERALTRRLSGRRPSRPRTSL